jgi:hypothetical protein
MFDRPWGPHRSNVASRRRGRPESHVEGQSPGTPPKNRAGTQVTLAAAALAADILVYANNTTTSKRQRYTEPLVLVLQSNPWTMLQPQLQANCYAKTKATKQQPLHLRFKVGAPAKRTTFAIIIYYLSINYYLFSVRHPKTAWGNSAT